MIWCDMMWYDVIWCDMMWYDVIWYEGLLPLRTLLIFWKCDSETMRCRSSRCVHTHIHTHTRSHTHTHTYTHMHTRTHRGHTPTMVIPIGSWTTYGCWARMTIGDVLYICVCMYVCMRVCMTHTYTHTLTHSHIHIHSHHTHTHIYTLTYTHSTHTERRAHTHIDTYGHTDMQGLRYVLYVSYMCHIYVLYVSNTGRHTHTIHNQRWPYSILQAYLWRSIVSVRECCSD